MLGLIPKFDVYFTGMCKNSRLVHLLLSIYGKDTNSLQDELFAKRRLLCIFIAPNAVYIIIVCKHTLWYVIVGSIQTLAECRNQLIFLFPGVFSEFQEISSFVNVNNANICGTTIKPKVRIKATGNIVLAASCQLQQVECEGGLLTINYNGQLSAHDLLLTNCELSVAGRLQLSGQLFLEASKVFFSDGATLVLNHVEMVSQSIMNAGIHILHVEDFILSDSRINCRSCTLSIAMLHFDKGAIIADNVSTSFPQCSNNLRKNYGGYHAGCGGQGECCPGGSMQPYGSLIYPDAMGMPGGTCTEKGGNGGGKIRLLVEDFIVLSPGVISARGGEPTGPGLGGGSGGSIYIATVCRDLEHITLDVRGGNAGSMANGQPSYGGSGGRISIMCSSGVVDPIWSNIMLEGGQNRASGPASYGAMGTYHLDDDFFDGYIYSGANNQIGMFWDVDTPHAPTFVYFDYSGSYRFYTETQSDIYLDCSPTSPGCTHSIKITMDMADDGTDAAIIVPATTSLNVPPWNVFYSRRTEPRHVNSSEDVCKLYYAGKSIGCLFFFFGDSMGSHKLCPCHMLYTSAHISLFIAFCS